ncbi:T9SS type A sorting domain-containing protein [Aequorivita sp. H23M31]|uniref:T9SS type A sorting domain-containing protein n=1 Tax=Aequorivita ciconiae TaxID=2494375 RepID=A0A410FZP3_9FLAO|nr:T9SS type A sorting domain-containing protein [Aequorivita sp. H23M31]QAA80495.1 T9SS type A sorting domain-containing protein [Aequorivita sp. H23M31]
MQNLLFFLSIFFTFSCFSQDYKPLLDNFNEWQFTYCYTGCLTDMYRTDGDTLVDGKAYKILDGYHYISRTFLLREEVESRKVYLNLAAASGNTEYLLYDFSLNVGDSIDIKNPITPFPADGGFYKVDSIVPRPLVDGNEYRHFYLSPTPSNPISSTPAVWIEGVGSLSLINAPGGFPNINGVGILTCFFKNGELFFSKREDCESMILGTPQNALNDVIVTTNFKDGNCRIYNAEKISSLEVFDLNGRKLIALKSANQEEITVDFSKFPTGTYFILAHSTNFEKKVFKVLHK